ncbi:DUF1007 family protein [Vibrio palustris]|uniref:DUF1007 family protein n=1 Tax=Vibrio palustris TaxID=1918946 RepID=A0A1R4B4W6_9VIBR|nr:DUF1007 family protein [Vibrio palustris]SJL83955.1 hypothetical protein VPAL9027_01934 [Vibrio palustris]
MFDWSSLRVFTPVVSHRSWFTLIGLLALMPTLAKAHPHSWVDMVTQINGNDHAITGFSMTWEFDPMTTAYLFDGEDMSKEHRKKTLQKLADNMIKNMLSTHYFTYFYQHKTTPIRYKTARNAVLTTKRGKATLKFDLPLTKPFTFINEPLKFLIFDPTYYVDMSWKGRDSIKLSPQLAKHCQYKIIAPNPTPKEVAYATNLPADADPDNSLGQLFTQQLNLTCH